MATETEIKLSLSPRAAVAFCTLPLLAGIRPLRQKLLNTYYDTPDLRLQHERIAVRYRKKGWESFLTVKGAAPSVGGLAQRSEWETAGLPGEFDFSHVDNSKLRHRLESLRDELTPVFTTHFTRTAWILEPQSGVRIELALDRGWIETQGRREPICEIELELLAGQPAALFALAGQLQSALRDAQNAQHRAQHVLHPEPASKAERGYRLFSDTPLQVKRASPLELEGRMASVAAFRAIALSCIAHLQGNEQGVRESETPEFIHQARVAIRRLRSAIRAWRPMLPTNFVTTFDAQWRALAAALGDTRNWDVFLTETLPPLAQSFPGHPVIKRVSRYALKQRTNSRKCARAAVHSVAYSRLLLEFTAAVLALNNNPEQPLKDFARRCLRQSARKVAGLAEASREDAACRHRLRVALKRLRYALEFFAPLFSGRRLQNYHQASTRLQDLLGRLNDLAVASQLTHAARPDYKTDLDLVDGWLGGQTDLLLHELDSSLAAFLQQESPWKRR